MMIDMCGLFLCAFFYIFPLKSGLLFSARLQVSVSSHQVYYPRAYHFVVCHFAVLLLNNLFVDMNTLFYYPVMLAKPLTPYVPYG